jgi:biopolymer transport protein ExbD
MLAVIDVMLIILAIFLAYTALIAVGKARKNISGRPQGS